MIETNLYDQDIYFSITYNGFQTFILEPDKWNKITNHLVRDSQWFGMWSDFIEDKYGLLFTFVQDGSLIGGASLLKGIYESIGSEAVVYFNLGNMVGNTPNLINQWRINLNTYFCDFGGVSVSIEKMTFQSKLQARFSTPCTINTDFNMDGNLLTKINTWQLRLHGKTLPEETIANSNIPQIAENTTDDAHSEYYYVIQPDFTNLSPNELSLVYEQPLGMIMTNSLIPDSIRPATDPTTAGLYVSITTPPNWAHPFSEQSNQCTPLYDGTLQVNVNITTDFYFGGEDSPPDSSIWWKIAVRVVQTRIIEGIQTFVSSQCGTYKTLSSGLDGSPTGSFGLGEVSDIRYQPNILPIVTGSDERQYFVRKIGNVNFNDNITLSVQAQDLIYVHLVMCPNIPYPTSVLTYFQFYNWLNDIKLNQLTTAPGSTATSYRASDLVTQMLESITGQKNALVSSFLSPGGAGYKYLFTNGYGIRNFGDLIYTPVKDLQSFLSDLQAIFCLGVGIKKVSNVEYLVVEELSYFFQSGVIAVFSDTFLWMDRHNSKYVFNEAELGYEKYEALNILQQDEFCTKSKYLLQFLQINQNKMSKLSGLIAAGYILEFQRRLQFLANQQQSATNDTDIFIISTNEPSTFVGVQWSTAVSPSVFITNPPFNYTGTSYGQPYIIFSITSMALIQGDQIFFNQQGIMINFTVTVIEEVVGYPQIGSDAYYVANLGNWVANINNPGDIVFDTLVNLWYMCIATTGIFFPAPSIATGYWVLWIDITEVTPLSFIVNPGSPNQVFAERNQPFQICAGCIDPSTIYNGRLSMKHILYNWRNFLGISLNSLLAGSNDYSVSQIVTTLAKMNSLFTTQFLSTEEFQGNIGQNITREIDREFIRNYLKNGSNIFTPVGSTFKVRCGWNTINTLRQALCGETGTSLDYGGVVAKDDWGNWWFCHVIDIQYDPVSEIVTFDVQKVNEVATPIGY